MDGAAAELNSLAGAVSGCCAGARQLRRLRKGSYTARRSCGRVLLARRPVRAHCPFLLVAEKLCAPLFRCAPPVQAGAPLCAVPELHDAGVPGPACRHPLGSLYASPTCSKCLLSLFPHATLYCGSWDSNAIRFPWRSGARCRLCSCLCCPREARASNPHACSRVCLRRSLLIILSSSFFLIVGCTVWCRLLQKHNAGVMHYWPKGLIKSDPSKGASFGCV